MEGVEKLPLPGADAPAPPGAPVPAPSDSVPPLPPTVSGCHALLRRLLSAGVLSPAALADHQSVAPPPPLPPSGTGSKKKKRRPYDHASRPTRPVALTLSYDGSGFLGYTSSQPGDNTVERHLFHALETACLVGPRDACGYSRSGRTDAGVSADGQVVRFDLRSRAGAPTKKRGRDGGGPAAAETAELDYPKILNGILPPAVRVLGWSPVCAEFNARFSCTGRTYKYFFVRRDLDLGAMDAALRTIVGRRDFRNLCKLDVEHVYCFERKILAAGVVAPATADGDDGDAVRQQVCHLRIVGQAFLWHMIRCIAHVAVLVGEGKEDPSIFAALLDVERLTGKPHYGLAAPENLVLSHCDYGATAAPEGTPQALWEATAAVEGRWERHTLAAARARETLDAMRGRCTVRATAVADFLRRREGGGAEAPRDDGGDDGTMTWGEALDMMGREGHRPAAAVPSADGTGGKAWRMRASSGGNQRHLPLLERGRGPTYEEKVAELKGRRKRTYDENMKKRKTPEEDRAFYNLKQNL